MRILLHCLIVLGGFLLAAPAFAQQPTQAQISAIRSACRGDYENVCASVPTGGKEALQCLEQHAAQVSPGCRQALAPLAAAQAQAPAAAAAPPPPASFAPMSLREEVRLLRADCGSNYQRYCSGVQPGGGRGLACLRSHWGQLDSACKSAMLSAAQK